MKFLSLATARTVKPIGYAVFTVLIFTAIGCRNNQRQASANVPAAATPSLFPEEGESQEDSGTPPLVGYSPDPTTYTSGGSEPKPAPAKKIPSSPKPFALRTGEKLVSHKAVSGDNLWKLAREYGTSVSRIKSANGLTSETIFKDKTYKIPTVNGRTVTQGSAPKPSTSTSTASVPRTLRTPAPVAPTPSRIAPSAPTVYTRDIPSTAPAASSSTGSQPKTFPVPTGGSSNTGSSAFPRPSFGSGNY